MRLTVLSAGDSAVGVLACDLRRYRIHIGVILIRLNLQAYHKPKLVLTQKSLLFFSCFILLLLAVMLVGKVIDESVFIGTLGLITGYIFRDNAGALRRQRRTTDREEETQ